MIIGNLTLHLSVTLFAVKHVGLRSMSDTCVILRDSCMSKFVFFLIDVN